MLPANVLVLEPASVTWIEQAPIHPILVYEDMTTSTGTYTSHPVVRQADVPLVIRQARECVEAAIGSSTSFAGTRMDRPASWQFEQSGNALFLITPVTGWQFPFAAPQQRRLEIAQPSSHAQALARIRELTALKWDRLAQLLGVSRQTLHLWEQNKPIVDDNRRRLLGVTDVLERAATRCLSSDQLRAWLDTPRGPEGLTPAELLERGEIGRARTLAISSPSANLRRAAPWVNRPVPEAFRAGAERRLPAEPPSHEDEFSGLSGHQSDDSDEVPTTLEE